MKKRVQRCEDVSAILRAVREGNAGAKERLFAAVYAELEKLARRTKSRERPGMSLATTDLVHEAYLRLVTDEELRFNNRSHFFAAAAEAMRRILVERARRAGTLRRGGALKRVPLDADLPFPGEAMSFSLRSYILALDVALDELERHNSRMNQLVKLRYFLGMSVRETAELLDVSPRTVKAEWRVAKAWIKVKIRGEDAPLPVASDAGG